MRFGKIHSTIWNDERFKGLDSESKLFYLYLLSSENCNAIGVFRIGYGTIEDEYECEDRGKLKTMMQELCNSGLIHYDPASKWLYFNNFIKWNLPTSPNHARQLAHDINDAVKEEAPVEALRRLVNSIKPVLTSLGYTKKGTGKDGEKEPRTYYDDFMAAINAPALSEYLRKDSKPSEALPKPCGGLHKPAEAVQYNNKDNNKDNDNDKYKNNDKIVLGTCKSNVASEITIPCANGQSCAVGASAIRPVIEALGGELSVASVKIQSYILANGIYPPADKAEVTAFINNEIMKAIDKGAIRA